MRWRVDPGQVAALAVIVAGVLLFALTVPEPIQDKILRLAEKLPWESIVGALIATAGIGASAATGRLASKVRDE
jgi:hypothetical protein